MRRKTIFSVLGLIVGIALVIAALVFIGNLLIGKNGILKQYKQEDTEYNKTEVVEKLNLIIKEKYFGDYKYAQENNKNIDEIYTDDYILDYLKTNKIIEELKDINDNLVQDEFYINTESLHRDIVSEEVKPNGSEGNGTKVFKLKKIESKYIIYFVDKYGEEEELGELVLHPII